MADKKQSKVLDDLASFYISQTNFDFNPNISPGKSTPQTSDSEPEHPIEVDPAILLELKNLFLNNTTVEPIRRNKAPLRAKHSMGGTTGERNSRRPSSSRSLAPPVPTKPKGQNGMSRNVMVPSGGVSVNEEAFSAARERLKLRSKSMSSPRPAGTRSTALEMHLEQARSKSQETPMEILDRSVTSQSRASRRTERGNDDGEILSNVLSGNIDTNDRKNRTPGKGRRSTPNRSKSADLADFTCVMRRVNERGDTSRRRRRDIEVVETSAADTPKITNANKSIAEVGGFLSNAAISAATPVASLGDTKFPSTVNDSSHKAPSTRPRSFSDRRNVAPVRSKSGDLASFNIPRFQSRDTKRTPHVAADGHGAGNSHATKPVLNSDNTTVFVPLNDQEDYKETNSTRNPPRRRRTPSRNKSSDLADLSTNRWGNKGVDAPTGRQLRPDSEEGGDNLAADAATTLDADKSTTAIGKVLSTPRIVTRKLVRNDGNTSSPGVSLVDNQVPLNVDNQVPLNDEEHGDAPSKPLRHSDQQEGALIRDNSSDIHPSHVRITEPAPLMPNTVDTVNYDEASLDLDLDDCTTVFVPLNDPDAAKPPPKAKSKRRTPSRSKSADMADLNTSRWGNDRGDAPRDMQQIRDSEDDNSAEDGATTIASHKSTSAVGKSIPKRLATPDLLTLHDSGETHALSTMSSGASLEVNRSPVKNEDCSVALSRPRSFSERKRMAPQVEEGNISTRPLRHRTNRQASESDDGGNATPEKHNSNHHRRSQRSGGATMPPSANHHPVSRTSRSNVESSGSVDSNCGDSKSVGTLWSESVDDQADMGSIRRLDPTASSIPSIEKVAHGNPSYLDEIEPSREPSQHTDNLLHDLVEKKPVKPSSFIFKGLLHKSISRKNDNADGNPLAQKELEPSFGAVAASKKGPFEKSHEKRGISVLKNLLKGSSHEKKNSRWGVIKASIDVSNALKKAAGTDRKHDTQETQREDAAEHEQTKIGKNGAKSLNIPTDARRASLTSPPSPAMMMSISSFAREDVEGLEEFHASLSAESRPREGMATAVSTRKGVRRSRSGEDPPTMTLPRRDYLSPVNDRRQVMGRLDPPSIPFAAEKTREIAVCLAFAPATIEPTYIEESKQGEMNGEREAESCITDCANIQVRLDYVDGALLDTTRTSLSPNRGYIDSLSPTQFTQLDFKDSKSQSRELSISVNSVNNDTVDLPADVRRSTENQAVVDPQTTEYSGPSGGMNLSNVVDVGFRSSDAHPDGDAPDVLDINFEPVVEGALLKSEISSMSPSHEPEPTTSPVKFMQLDINPTKSRSTELSTSVHTAKSGPVALSAKVRKRVQDRVVVDHQKTEYMGPSEDQYLNQVDVGIWTSEALPDGEAPDPIEVEYEHLRRQITASLVRTKASREAAVSLRREIKSQQQFFEKVKKERDTMLKALRDKNVALVVV